uniref:Uncharacterized protein n=1 Tax=Acrobeloides nanus TaxID=290746 RepID=A0A914C6N4_9BILA
MKLSERILVVCLFVIIFVNIFLLSTKQLVIHEQIEPNNYFWPPGQDNTTPFNDTNFLTVIPRVGCDNLTKLIVGVRSIPSEFELIIQR